MLKYHTGVTAVRVRAYIALMDPSGRVFRDDMAPAQMAAAAERLHPHPAHIAEVKTAVEKIEELTTMLEQVLTMRRMTKGEGGEDTEAEDTKEKEKSLRENNDALRRLKHELERMEDNLEDERERAVRQVMKFNVHNTIKSLEAIGKSLDVKAGIYCAACLEHLAFVLLDAAGAVAFRAMEDKVYPKHIQMAVRGSDDLTAMWNTKPSTKDIMEYFLDSRTATTLGLREEGSDDQAGMPAPVHPDKSASGDALFQRHGQGQGEAFSDGDLTVVMRRAHPLITLSHETLVFVSSLLRDTFDDIKMKMSGMVHESDVQGAVQGCVPGKVATAACQFAQKAVDRYELVTPAGSHVAMRIRLLKKNSISAGINIKQPRNQNISIVCVRACEKFSLPRNKTVFVYSGNTLAEDNTPAEVGMDDKVDVYAIPQEQWSFKRREEARRGILESNTSPTKDMTKVRSKVKQHMGDGSHVPGRVGPEGSRADGVGSHSPTRKVVAGRAHTDRPHQNRSRMANHSDSRLGRAGGGGSDRGSALKHLKGDGAKQALELIDASSEYLNDIRSSIEAAQGHFGPDPGPAGDFGDVRKRVQSMKLHVNKTLREVEKVAGSIDVLHRADSQSPQRKRS